MFIRVALLAPLVGACFAASAGAAHAQPADPTTVPGPAEDPGATPTPASAAQALGWASAAYDRGDLERMMELSRQVAEGALPGDDEQRAQALRLLGIGLYLSSRPDGAERAFTELLRLRPHAELDPRLTRPEVVAFFHEVRRRSRPRKRWGLSFLPPFGQFQNGTPRRGWVIAGLEVLTLGTVVTTAVLKQSWVNDSDGTCKSDPLRPARCQNLRRVNLASAAAFAATYGFGVIDALLNYRDEDPPPPTEPRVSFIVLPQSAALRLTF